MIAKSGEKKIFPTNTIAPLRVRLFQHSKMPTCRTEGDGWLETSHGKCRVVGRLGQRHADLIESVLFCAEDRRDLDDGRIDILVDPAKIRKCMSGGTGQYSHEQLNKLLMELMSVVIEIQTPNMRDTAMGHIIDYKTPTLNKKRRDPLSGKERPIWVITLGRAYCTLIDQDLPQYRDPSPIANLRYGISQAVARYCLTHSSEPNGGWRIDTVIQAVAGVLKGQAVRDARRYIQTDAERLQQIGVIVNVETGRVHLRKN